MDSDCWWVIASIATGWMIISSGDEAAPNPVNITVNDSTKTPATQNQASDQAPSETQSEAQNETQGEIIEQAEGQIEETQRKYQRKYQRQPNRQMIQQVFKTAQTDIEPEKQDAAPAAQPAADDTDIPRICHHCSAGQSGWLSGICRCGRAGRHHPAAEWGYLDR